MRQNLDAQAEFSPPVHLFAGGSLWLHIWYRAICQLDAAWGCDATLVVLPSPKDDGDGKTLHGSIEHTPEGRARIYCALEHEPCESLGTLLHEVAHFAQNPRHTRHHGYSFRRGYLELVREFTGIDIGSRVAHVRQMCPKISRAEALDMATVHTLDTIWFDLDIRMAKGDRFVVTTGARTFLVPVGSIG